MALLERLGASAEGRLTTEGASMQRLPVHPRLARVLLSAGGGARAAAACAVLAEAWRPAASGDAPTTDSDVLSAADRIRDAPAGVREAARELQRVAADSGVAATDADADERLLRALVAGFPDRVARRREPGSPRLALERGHRRAARPRERRPRRASCWSRSRSRAASRGRAGEPLVRTASRVERAWLEGVTSELVHRFDEATGSVRAVCATRTTSWCWESGRWLPIRTKPRASWPTRSSDAASARRGSGCGAGCGSRGWRRTSTPRCSRPVADARACRRSTRPSAGSTRGTRATLDRLAPERLALPSGRTAALEYREDGSVFAAVKLQELFGLAETPRIGPRREPVVFELLAPNARPVQTTRDLRSFWERTYPEVRKELRGRYPRHPWPDDPWSAEPTHRAKSRR